MSETTRTYELGYLLAPTISETQIEASVQTLSDAISTAGGTIVATGAPEYIDLAYTMEKHIASKINRYSQAYFGWVKFDADPETMEALKKVLDSNVELIRYLMVKTSTHNTVIFKKPKIEAKRESSAEELIDEVLEAENTADDIIEDHEKLPDLEGDILDEEGTQAPKAVEEKEE